MEIFVGNADCPSPCESEPHDSARSPKTWRLADLIAELCRQALDCLPDNTGRFQGVVTFPGLSAESPRNVRHCHLKPGDSQSACERIRYRIYLTL